jgi:hypothetical protein
MEYNFKIITKVRMYGTYKILKFAGPEYAHKLV